MIISESVRGTYNEAVQTAGDDSAAWRCRERFDGGGDAHDGEEKKEHRCQKFSGHGAPEVDASEEA